jgi:hypothetical protein
MGVRDSVSDKARARLARLMVCAAVLCLLVSSVSHETAAQADLSPISISNEFIRIFVNPGPDEAGRFGVETTGGDPAHAGDDETPLIYGRPMPWTSFSTFRIDGSDWVFGGKTTRRAGRTARYGVQLAAPAADAQGSKIVTKYALGDIVVTQELSFAKSPTTRYLDTARIHYIVENTGIVTRQVGLRVLIDTMLGQNDGAPLRAGDMAVTSDLQLEGGAIPDYWQAFDSLSSPTVTSQGTLTGGELTDPDTLAFSNWGTFADHPWDATIVPGREFVRERESDLDSAVALYWQPSALVPGEVRHYVTYYGLGGITLAPGQLTLGITAPSEVGLTAQGTATFTAVSYVTNTGKGPAHDVTATINLPAGFSLAPGQQARRAIGDLEPGGTGQAAWKVVVDLSATGAAQFSVAIAANNADPNAVTRRIDVLGPPRLLASIRRVEAVENRGERLYPWPLRATLRVENTGGSSAYWVKARLDSTGGLELVGADSRDVFLGTLEPGQSQDVVFTLGGAAEPGEKRISMTATAQNAPASIASASVQVPRLVPKVWARPSADRVTVGDIVHCDVMVTNVPDARRIKFDVVYEGSLVYAMVSRGTLNAAGAVVGQAFADWNGGDAITKPGRISGMEVGLVPDADGMSWGSAASVYFLAASQGVGRVHIENVVLLDSGGQEIPLEQPPASCAIAIAGKK